jgi:hypothetical protein
MDNNLAGQIEQRIAELPEDVRSAVLSVEWETKVQAIGARNKLHIDQTGALGDATLMAMLGFFELSQFPGRIAEELKVPPDKAATLAKEVSDEVFMSIRESLKKLSGGTKESAPPPQTPPKPIPPPPPPKPPLPKPDLSAADNMLRGKTVSLPSQPPPKPVAPPPPVPAPAPKPPAPPAPPAMVSPPAETPPPNTPPPKPPAYSADPYREPPV